MTEPFDFASIEGHLQQQEDGKEIEILLPDGKPTGLKIVVSGPDSDRVRKAIRWQRDQLAKDGISDERRIEVAREAAARCCSGWSGARLKGEDVAWSIEQAVRWFTNWPFVQRQVDTATGDTARFMPA